MLAEVADPADDLVHAPCGDRSAGLDEDDVGFAQQLVQVAVARRLPWAPAETGLALVQVTKEERDAIFERALSSCRSAGGFLHEDYLGAVVSE
jgi:hypothetical protein